MGSHVAYSLAAQGICDQIVLLDIDGQKASSQAEDIADAVPSLLHPVQVTAGGYDDIADADVVVLAACGSAVEQDRLQELEATWAVAEAIAPQLVACGFCGIVVSISNPCDIIAQRFAQRTGLQVIGTGTALDSARLRRRLAQGLGVAPHSVCAYMLGEHGDTSFVPWSMATVAGVKIDDYCRGAFGGRKFDIDYDDVVKYVRESGGMVIKRKGATYYAIAVSVCRIIEMLDMCDNGVAVVSTMMHGEYGVDDVCISTPCIVGPHGIKGKLLVSMTDEEIEKLRASGRAMKAAMEALTY